MARSTRKPNVTVLLGVAGMVATGILIAIALISAQPTKVALLVPSGDIPAFREVSLDDLVEIEVNEDPALSAFLSVARANELTEDGAKKLYSVSGLRSGLPIDASVVTADPNKGLQIVSGDERLVGVTTNLPGSLVGAVDEGAVVDVIASSTNSGGTATYAKVIAIGGEDAAKGVAGANEDIAGAQEENDQAADEIQVIVAVASADAAAIAGQEVAMTLLPFCQITPEGKIVPTSDDRADACQPPADREAAR
ncbi:hypothetical protein [Miltoncostaea oceani]|uniref:hypothetical protein n=1 Tax=Miltoncostaea oceani TaxID=2843216 RepID=UPI001C3C2726|nr:hypothetical protein [Miltoncostaea oceani]